MLTDEDKNFLLMYSDSEYQKPSVTVDAVVFRLSETQSQNYRKLPQKKLQVFLTKRSYPPFKNKYAVIGTFIDLNFELSKTMKLCVKKKVNLQNFYFEQLYTFGEKTRDPRTRVLSTSYMLLTNKEEKLENGEWFDVNGTETILKNTIANDCYEFEKQINLVLSNQNNTFENILNLKIKKQDLQESKTVSVQDSYLAFDHAKIIYYALERLKNKLEYTDIIFNLLPKYFTLTELKNCYEVILGEKLLDANFRRKTAKLVVPTQDFVTGKGHRSSQLFTHNPFWNVSTLD